RVQERDLAGLDGVERRRSRVETGIEYLRLERGEQEARVTPVGAVLTALEQRARGLGVAAIASEALRSEAVREPTAHQLGEAARRRCQLLARELAHHQLEAVRAQLPGAELVRMAHRLEHAEAVAREAPRTVRVEPRHRQPLARDGDAILAPGVADVR